MASKTIVKMPSGKWKAVIRDSGAFLASKTFRLKADAKTWADNILGDREYLKAIRQPTANRTLDDLITEYREQWKGKDESLRSCKDGKLPMKHRFWSEQLGHIKLIDITASDVVLALDGYRAGKALRGDRKKGTATAGRDRSPATVNRMKASLSAMLNFAVGRTYLQRNVARDIKGETEDNRRKNYLSDEDIKDLRKACRKSPWDKLELLVLMAVMTGARKSELLGLRWSDIDFGDMTTVLKNTKNGDMRTLAFTGPAAALLKKHRQAGTHLIFRSTSYARRPMEFKKQWANAVTAAGLEDCRFHDLRHTNATKLLNSGVTEQQSGHMLGHRSAQSIKRYQHQDKEATKAIADKAYAGWLEDSPDVSD